MKNRFLQLMLAACCLALAGCSLAQPENTGEEDQFVGFYLVRTADGNIAFSANPSLSEYGEETLDLGNYGKYAAPRQVLFAEEDGSFPGLEGFPLYLQESEDEQGSTVGLVTTLPDSNLELREESNARTVDISGTIYAGLPAGAGEDWDMLTDGGIWRALTVYQTADGRAYLDGTGQGFNGPSTYTQSFCSTAEENGETVTYTLNISVEIAQAERMESAAVIWLDSSGNALERELLDLSRDTIHLTWPEKAAWAAVEERYAAASRHSALDRPGQGEEAASCTLIVLDESGIGRAIPLEIAEEAE